ncbi:MAG: bile acid:sodium symporter family protein [Planctomycetota bacterium]
MPDRFLHVCRTVIERFLLVWLVLLSLAAYCWGDWLGKRSDPFLATFAYREYLFAVTMLAIGSLLPPAEVRHVMRRWPTVVGGTAIQYTSMPILAYGFGRLFGLEGPWLIGIVMVGCVPGAMASNVLTLAARGNVSYSLSLTTSATIFSPLFVPVALGLALSGLAEFSSAEVASKVTRVALQLMWMVVLPVVAGYVLSQVWPWWAAAAKRVAAIVANLTILWIIAVVVARNRDNLGQMDLRLLLALLLVNLGGYAAGLLGGRLLRLPDPMRRALTLEIGMQNAGLGTVLVSIISTDPMAEIAPAVYTFGCMLTGTVLARLWAEFGSRAAAEASDP